MPIYNTSYRAWNGRFNTQSMRWWTICVTGIRRASQSKWLRRLMFAAFLPLLFFAFPLFFFEQSNRDPESWRVFVNIARTLPQTGRIEKIVSELPRHPTAEQFDTIRHDAWSVLLLTMLRYPQAFLMVIVVGIVAPPLISQDLRTRAYLIYFARPITRLEYIAGKVGVVSFYLASISAVPALVLYCVGLLLSPSVTVALTTWDMPLRIVLASICLVVPTTLVALAISSFTLESRYAAFAWFAMWIMGYVTYSTLATLAAFEVQPGGIVQEPGWRLLTSPYHVLGKVQSYIFGFENESAMVLPAVVCLAGVSVLALLILMRRVNSPMRV